MDKPDFDNLYDIFKDYPVKLEQVKTWEKTFRKAALVDNLYEHDAVKQLIDLLKGYIEDNEEKLKAQRREDFTRDELFFAARERLAIENGAWKLLISFFTNSKSQAMEIGEKVKETKKLNGKK